MPYWWTDTMRMLGKCEALAAWKFCAAFRRLSTAFESYPGCCGLRYRSVSTTSTFLAPAGSTSITHLQVFAC